MIRAIGILLSLSFLSLSNAWAESLDFTVYLEHSDGSSTPLRAKIPSEMTRIASLARENSCLAEALKAVRKEMPYTHTVNTIEDLVTQLEILYPSKTRISVFIKEPSNGSKGETVLYGTNPHFLNVYPFDRNCNVPKLLQTMVTNAEKALINHPNTINESHLRVEASSN